MEDEDSEVEDEEHSTSTTATDTDYLSYCEEEEKFILGPVVDPTLNQLSSNVKISCVGSTVTPNFACKQSVVVMD